MRIIEAISDMNIGGAGVLLLTRLSTDGKMRDATTVVIPRGSELKKRLDGIGVKSIEIDCCAERSFEISAIPKYMRIIRRLKPDIINAHGCLSFRIAAFFCGVPVKIYTRHCTFPLKKTQKSLIYKFTVGRLQGILSDGIIAVADVVKKDLIAMGVPAKKIRVIINGVAGIRRLSEPQRREIRGRLNIPQTAVVIGIFARIEEYKGHKDLVDAAVLLLEKSDNYRFLVVGKGSYEEKLMEYCREKGVFDRFVFTGFAEDITEYLNITDINVNCSHGTETSSLSLSEGMSIGLPTVASDYGGNRYMVEDGVNGFRYPPYNGEALARSIQKISGNDKLRRRISENAQVRYERKLNSRKMTKATYDHYMRLASVRKNIRLENL